MIDRYARPKMKAVWSEENRYETWLMVELAVCEAWAEMAVIPQEDMAKLRGARHNLDRLHLSNQSDNTKKNCIEI